MSVPRRPVATKRNRGERGFVLITIAAAAVALVAVLGLAVDAGRLYIAKNEAQAYCDAAALAAVLQLDGQTTGIDTAKATLTSSTSPYYMNNAWNLDSANVTGATIDFATVADGPWETNPNPAAGYIYARVRLTLSESLYFIPAVVGQYAQNVSAQAIAGQIGITSFHRGLSPYTAVS